MKAKTEQLIVIPKSLLEKRIEELNELILEEHTNFRECPEYVSEKLTLEYILKKSSSLTPILEVGFDAGTSLKDFGKRDLYKQQFLSQTEFEIK